MITRNVAIAALLSSLVLGTLALGGCASSDDDGPVVTLEEIEAAKAARTKAVVAKLMVCTQPEWKGHGADCIAGVAIADAIERGATFGPAPEPAPRNYLLEQAILLDALIPTPYVPLWTPPPPRPAYQTPSFTCTRGWGRFGSGTFTCQ